MGIVAHFSGSSMYGTHPTVKHMISSKTVLSTERQKDRGRLSARIFKDTQTPSALLFISTVLI